MDQEISNARSVEQMEEDLRDLKLKTQRLRNQLDCWEREASRLIGEIPESTPPRQTLPYPRVPKLELPAVFDGDTSKSPSAYASPSNHPSYTGKEILWTSSRQQKRKRKSSERGSAPTTPTHFARKPKQEAKRRSTNKGRREKQVQQQEHWLTPEEPETISSRASEDDMDRCPLQKWIEIARYSYGVKLHDDRGDYPYNYYDGGGGFFLMVNLATREAVLQRYETWEGSCEMCYDRIDSDDGRDLKMQSLLNPRIPEDQNLRASHVVPCEEMYRRAQLCIDPDMHLRSVQEGEKHFQAVATLYGVYSFFHIEQVMMSHARDSWLSKRRWSCRVWDAGRLRGVVRLQALCRGWSCRNRVGYIFSPHCELGRRFLMLQWRRWLTNTAHESSTVLHAV